MTKEQLNELLQDIEDVASNFEDKPWTANVKLLKEDFDIASANNPKKYWKTKDQLEELLRETRILFIFSILNRVCVEEGKLYYFDTPYQASMRYDGVMKKEGTFYMLDEDGDFREIFSSEKFTQYIDDMYWELYEDDAEE